MTADDFRALALALPEVDEQEHHGHPDFRVGGKVFATLAPDASWGMVKLAPAQQAERVAAAPETFDPFAGAWGVRGATRVRLAAASRAAVRSALRDAWRNVAPKRLRDAHD